MGKWSVWVGGVEINDHYLTEQEAEHIARLYESRGYDDVTIMKDWRNGYDD